MPDAVGFLILKTAVCRYREKPKDPYDIYYYCRYSDDPAAIRDKFKNSISEPAVQDAANALKKMFAYEDSKWVEMILDYMEIVGADARDQDARIIVRTIGRVTDGIP